MIVVFKNCLFATFFLILFFATTKTVNAGQFPTTFEGISNEQGWLIRNDYTTKMNPPNCKLRETTDEERTRLAKECDQTDACFELTDLWIKQWDQYYCSEIGMTIRTDESGKKVAFFDDTNEESIQSIEQTIVENKPDIQQLNPERIGFWVKIQQFISSVISKISDLFSN